VSLCDILDSKEEELLPSILSFISQINVPVHTGQISNVASGNNAIRVRSHADKVLFLEKERDEPVKMGNAEWQELIGSQCQPADPRPTKSDYVDYSELGPAFKLSEALKNTHKLDPSMIPNALRQMAHYRLFVPLSMFTTQALKMIWDNTGDLYMKKKTGLSVDKYVLNSDQFPSKDTLTKQTFFSSHIETGSNSLQKWQILK